MKALERCDLNNNNNNNHHHHHHLWAPQPTRNLGLCFAIPQSYKMSSSTNGWKTTVWCCMGEHLPCLQLIHEPVGRIQFPASRERDRTLDIHCCRPHASCRSRIGEVSRAVRTLFIRYFRCFPVRTVIDVCCCLREPRISIPHDSLLPSRQRHGTDLCACSAHPVCVCAHTN
jgi:hypothetical protein